MAHGTRLTQDTGQDGLSHLASTETAMATCLSDTIGIGFVLNCLLLLEY